MFILYVTLFTLICRPSLTDITYTLAILNENGTTFDPDLPKTGPAFELGMEAIQQMMRGRIKFHFIEAYLTQYRPGCTDNKYTSTLAELYLNQHINGVIGPACTMAIENFGRMLADWNIPIITQAGAGGSLSDKVRYPTLTRMSYTMVKFASFYLDVLNYFNWTDITFFYQSDHYPATEMGGYVKDELITMNVNVNVVEGIELNENVHDIQKKLELAKSRCRVLLMVATGNLVRRIIITASRMGMTNGDFVFLVHRGHEGDMFGDVSWKRGDHLDEMAKKAYQAVMVVQYRKPTGQAFNKFDSEVKLRSLRDYGYDWGDSPVNIFTTSVYDGFLLYAHALNETLNAGEDIHDGRNIMKHLWGQTFEGITRTVSIDQNGDRDTDFSLLDVTDTIVGEYMEVATYLGDTKEFNLVPGQIIHWPNNRGPPINKPVCGFLNDAAICQTDEFSLVGIVSIVFGLAMLITGLVAGMIYRNIRLEADLLSQWWKVRQEDIQRGATSNFSRSVYSCTRSSFHSQFDNTSQIFTEIAIYKGVSVAIKKLKLKHITIDRETAVELRLMRDINTPHLTKMYGLWIDEPNIRVLTEYCSRGSLHDIVQNDAIKLDRSFKISLAGDAVRGMAFIHSSPLILHGRLNSSNCVIDGRFILKITDFGLLSLRRKEHLTSIKNKRNLLWVAPEHLRTDPYKDYSVAGDIYSFGIILFELLTRCDPYEEESSTMVIPDILECLKRGSLPLLRPKMNIESDEPAILQIMHRCWDENPGQRPNFSAIKRAMKAGKWDISGKNVFDTLLSRMEQYANNLEGLVEERTRAFLEEKKKAEDLLYHILPRTVADKLKNGDKVDPEQFESVTIYFSDIVGFTNLSASSTALEIVDFLNDLYTCFDTIIENFDVYKVETIGDAYMVVSGLPNRNGNEHARQIARMSLSILESLKHFKARHKADEIIKARIGLHSGCVCSGVVGLRMPRYCLFGDAVNTASRMESNGEAMKIHISHATYCILETFDIFSMDVRGVIPIKGKGTMTTYWLNGENTNECLK